MTTIELGKIKSVRFGFGGYQDAQFGLTVDMGGDGWGVGDFKGWWSSPPSSGAKWTEADRREGFSDLTLWLIDLMTQAKVHDVADLHGVPVEITFDGNLLKSWRVLSEVL